MRINNKIFQGTTNDLVHARQLWRTVGNVSPYTEFLSVRFPNRDLVYLFLLTLYNCNICCYMTGGFVYYIVGIFHSYVTTSLFIALTDVNILDVIFQCSENVNHVFPHRRFSVSLPQHHWGRYKVYRVTYGTTFELYLTCYGVDSRDCGPKSNLDLIHFMWQHFERFGFRKHVITLLPSDYREHFSVPLMRCLRDRRALSDGWRDLGTVAIVLSSIATLFATYANVAPPPPNVSVKSAGGSLPPCV